MNLSVVSAPREAHRSDCRFGPGFYRVLLSDGSKRYCQSEGEVEFVLGLLSDGSVRRVQRDGWCLDSVAPDGTDAHTPDVVDAAFWLALPVDAGMRELGLTSEADYIRAYRMVEDAVLARDRERTVHVPVVIKRPGRKVIDV